MGRTEKGNASGDEEYPFKPVGGSSRSPRDTNRGSTPRGDEERPMASQIGCTSAPEKSFNAGLMTKVTVPETDTGGRGEYPKALEKTLVKELGKLTP